MAKTSPGRPTKKKGTAQNKCVSVWLLADEKESVQKAADSVRMPVSMWAGRVLIEASKRALAAVGM
jgi:hypothetical protein